MKETAHATSAFRRYLIEFSGAMGAYVAVMLVVMPFVRQAVDSPWRVPVGLVPLLPVGLAVWAMVRHYHRMDEMARRAIIESLGMAFVLAAPTVITLGFLDSAGLEVDIWWAWVTMGASWLVGALLVGLRYR